MVSEPHARIYKALTDIFLSRQRHSVLDRLNVSGIDHDGDFSRKTIVPTWYRPPLYNYDVRCNARFAIGSPSAGRSPSRQ